MPGPDPSNKSLRWDLLGFILAGVVSVALIFVLDTGPLAQWIAAHKESKLDEAILVGIFFLAGLSFLFLRRWREVSLRLERSAAQQLSPVAERARRGLRRDIIGVGVSLVIGLVLVLVFDTGALAEWLAKHKDTKVDEIIVTSAVLLVGLSFFSIRRWMQLTDHLRKYEELHQRTRKLNHEAALLGELSDLLQSCLSFEEAHPVLTTGAQVLLPGSSGAICIIASSRNVVEVTATWGEPALDEPLFAPQNCWALRRGRVHLYERDRDTAKHCAHLAQARPQRALCVPMMAHGETIGLFYVDTGIPRDTGPVGLQLAAAEQVLARTIAEQASLALANLKLREILRTQSVRDPLTNLYNRLYMEESLDRELSRATRKKTPLGLMMLDVDHFKRFNDTFGHDAGDMVLRTLANTLRTQLRAEDIICRYGGEEFTVILPDASLESCRRRAEQLREVIKGVATEFRGQPLERITLSVGVAAFPDNGATREALVEVADAALYRAKAQGRDCVVVA
jgi:diguanylate cyclase (GGDEF)-like protein